MYKVEFPISFKGITIVAKLNKSAFDTHVVHVPAI